MTSFKRRKVHIFSIVFGLSKLGRVAENIIFSSPRHGVLKTMLKMQPFRCGGELRVEGRAWNQTYICSASRALLYTHTDCVSLGLL